MERLAYLLSGDRIEAEDLAFILSPMAGAPAVIGAGLNLNDATHEFQRKHIQQAIDAAVDQYAIETNRTTGAAVAITDWTNYLKKGTSLYNSGNSLLGTAYGAQTVDSIPQVPAADYAVLSDVASTGFWSPYGP